MNRPAPLTAQRGVVLWLLLIIVAMAGGYAFYRNANTQFTRSGQDTKLAVVLAQAKEAVIAYAVMDESRPGRLLCPALLGDGISPLLSGVECDTYIGQLPWKTLDVRDFQDDHGTRLQLAVYNLFGGRDRAINSDTATGMRVIAADGSVNDDVVAAIIAPRGILDPANSDGDNTFQAGKSATDGDNDLIAVITRRELMAAVEKRVANEVRSCLDQHAASTANTDHRYPWPAPLSASAFQGKANSLFGWVPATQPTAGPESALKSTTTRLTQTLSQLSLAPDARQQLTALSALNDALLQARNLFDVIFINANQIRQLADGAASQLASLESTVNTASANGRISISEGSNIRTLANAPDTALGTLSNSLTQFGIDVFPWQIGQYISALKLASSPTEFGSLTQTVRDLLLATSTPRPDIPLASALTAALSACGGTGSDQTTCNGTIAKLAAPALITRLIELQKAVANTRISVLASDVSVQANLLSSLNTALRAMPNAANRAALLAAQNDAQLAINGITTGIANVTSARIGAIAALDAAVANLQASPTNDTLIDSSTANAIAAITALATTISINEQVDNNVSHTSLQAAIDAYDTALGNFTLIDTASPRPVQPLGQQSQIAQAALTLGKATVTLEIWAKSISANAGLVAPLAKANLVAAGADAGSATILDGSAYKIASDGLASITGKNESNALLQAYLDSPSAANQAKAEAALAETSALVSSLLTAANNLDAPLSSTQATAFPMIWLSSRCDFLLPGASTWWQTNLWTNLVLYQIGSPTISEPGRLTVNGSGGYRVVALAVGRALALAVQPQSRPSAQIQDFLEGINADLSRNGDATAPATSFTAQPPSATFNDRLSY